MSQKIALAQIIAYESHSGHYRKKSLYPFPIHLFRTAEFLHKNFGDLENLEELKIAMLLHDSIEDTWITKEFLEEQFGKKVALLVQSLSENKSKPKKDYVKQLVNSSDDVKLLKLIDINDNINDSFDGDKWGVFLKDCEEILQNLEVKNKVFKQRFNDLKQQSLKKIAQELINL